MAYQRDLAEKFCLIAEFHKRRYCRFYCFPDNYFVMRFITHAIIQKSGRRIKPRKYPGIPSKEASRLGARASTIYHSFVRQTWKKLKEYYASERESTDNRTRSAFESLSITELRAPVQRVRLINGLRLL